MRQNTFKSLLEECDKQEIVEYLTAYNTWVQLQLKIGGLIFSPEDYFGIWQGQVR